MALNPPPVDTTHLRPWQRKLHRVIFEADTPAGKLFDLILLGFILLSVVLVMAESIQSLDARYGPWFKAAEWVVTVFFTVEYILRILCVARPTRYIFSFFGIIDLLSILPTFLSLILEGSQFLSVIRILRLLRIFRILKLNRFISESNMILISLKRSSRKILVFLFFVLLINIIMGAVIFTVEHDYNPGFSSIPQSIYWAIVTLSTVGYGDVAPVTVLGKIIASVIMITGYSIIAVPTGIVTVELNREKASKSVPRVCASCLTEGHDTDARFCKACGAKLS